MSLSGWRILAGRLLQSRGPAAAKLRSPSSVLVRGMMSVIGAGNGRRERQAGSRLQGTDEADRLYHSVICSRPPLPPTELQQLINDAHVSVFIQYWHLQCFDLIGSVALLVARRTNDRKVVGSRPTKVVCITVLTGNRMG